MNNSPEPETEAERLRALRAYAILDTPPEPTFDSIVRRAAALLETPIALLTFIDDRRQWIKARTGFALPELPRDVGFDATAIRQAEPLIVPDTSQDPRFAQDPLVVSELNIRFYAGVALRTADGHAIGALSVMDYTPRQLSSAQIAALEEQASLAMRELEKRTTSAPAPEPAPIAPPPEAPPAAPERRALLPDVIMRFGPDFRYTYVSPFAAEAIGIAPEALLGRPVGSERVPVAFADPLRSALQRAVENRRIEEIEFLYVSPSGERLFQTRLMPEVRGGEVQAILSITREVGPGESDRAGAAPAGQTLRGLLGIAIAEAVTTAELLQRCAEALAEFSGATLMRIWLRDATGSALRLSASAGEAASQIAGEPGRTVLEVPAEEATFDALAERTFGFEAVDAEARGLGFRRALPMETEGVLIGIVAFRSRITLSDDVQEAMADSAGTIAAAVHRSRESETATEQAAALARDLLEARLALQREAENAASLAHELRTPLNSVLGLTNLLLGTSLDPAQREMGELTRSSAQALVEMLNEMLEAPKRPEGAGAPQNAPFDMRQVIEEVGAMLAARAQAKRIDLVTRCAPEMPERLIGDAGRIRQILTNLVDNAIKFTGEGYVLVDAAPDEVDNEAALISIEVEDTGPGIAPEEQQAIFERHVRAGGAGEREPGYGLGLAISREFAEQMGGSITLSSEPGSGSVFRVTLRLPGAEGGENTPPAGIAGLHVLVVDGPQLQQFALRELMASWGARVELCATIGEMLDTLQAGSLAGDPFQAILLDERMAGGESSAMIGALLASDSLGQARLILMTGVARSAEAERLIAEGAADGLTKPVRRGPLQSALAAVALRSGAPVAPAGGTSARQKRAAPAAEPGAGRLPGADRAAGPVSGAPLSGGQAAPPAAPVAGATRSENSAAVAAEAQASGRADVDDREGAQDRTYALVVEDDAVNQRVTKMMLEKMGCVVDVASSGPEAIELFETRVYDLVLVDCRMPGMDGYETTAALRRMEGDERHTPIVAITADTSEGVRERCLEAGMDAYIAKPVHAEDLQHAIDKLLNASLPDREPAPPGQIDEVLDRRALLARVAGNTEVLRSLANLCQAECNRLMSEIREAIKTGDRAEFLRATHKLRGSIMSMEARAAVDAVQRLELTANQGRPADAEEMLDQLRRELDRLITAMYALIDEADDGGDSP